MVGHWLLYLAALLGTLLFHTYYTGWFSWYLLLLLLAMPPFSLVCSLSAMRSVRLCAEMRTKVPCEEPAQLVFSGTGRWLPAPVYRFRLTRTDEMTGEQTTIRLQLAAQERTVVQIPTGHCGCYRYALSRARVYDYLGLFALPMRELPPLGVCEIWPQARAPQPLPNLSQFHSRSFRPKYGGGFSEIHELREYRPGDPMRDVHWKLSAKTDDLIVREPMEANRGQVIVSFDLSGTRQQIDSTLSQLLWLSGWLTEKQVTHEAFWLEPLTLEPQSRTIAEPGDLEELVRALLSTRLAEATPSVAARPFPRADWRYHIRQEAGEKEAAQ